MTDYSARVEKSLMPMDLIRAVARYKFSIIAAFLVFLMTVNLLIFGLLSPTWKVKSNIMLDFNFVTQPLLDAPPPSDFEKTVSFHTQKDLLKSKLLLGKVVKALDLGETRVIGKLERIRISISGIKRWVGQVLGIKKWDVPFDYEAAAMKALLNNVKVEAQPDSKLIHIEYKAKSGPEAEKTLAKLLEIYIDDYNSDVVRQASGVLNYLNAQVGNVRQDLAQSEYDLLALKNERGDRNQLNIGVYDLTDSTEVRDEIKLYLLRLEESSRNAKLIRDKRQRERALSDIQIKIEQYSELLNDLPEAELGEHRVRREIQSHQEFLNLLSRNIAKARAVASGEAELINLVRIVDEPAAQTKPDFPKGSIMLLLNLFMSTAVGLFFGFFRYMNDPSIFSRQELKQLSGLNTLARLRN